MAKVSTSKLAAIIKSAKNKEQLAEAQATIAAAMRITPLTLAKTKAAAFWDKQLAGVDFKANGSVVVYGTKKKGAFFVPPPFLFEEGAAFEFAKLHMKNPKFDVSYDSKEKVWTAKCSNGSASHRYLAAAIVQAMLV